MVRRWSSSVEVTNAGDSTDVKPLSTTAQKFLRPSWMGMHPARIVDRFRDLRKQSTKFLTKLNKLRIDTYNNLTVTQPLACRNYSTFLPHHGGVS